MDWSCKRNKQLHKANVALDMANKALEIVNDFESAQIITDGRLNGRTYAYKCGLAKGEKIFNIFIRELIREFDKKHPALFADYMQEFNSHPISENIEYMWDMHDLIEDIKYRLPNKGSEEK